jgi:hypothetical protein
MRVLDYSHIPGMLSPAEKHYLYDLTSRVYKGEGAVVEIGCWLGSSAAYLGGGLNTKWKTPLYCFDRFQADAAEVNKAKRQGVELAIGQDTLPVFCEFLRDVYSYVKPIKTDVNHIQWKDEPIEILHLDAPKKAAEITSVFKIFGPWLMPGRSVLVLQDFVFPGAYAIPLIMGFWGEAFELLHMPDTSKCTVSFRYQKQISFDKTLDIFTWPKEKVFGCWRRMEERLPASVDHAYFNFGLARYFFDRGDFETARRIGLENRGRLTPSRIDSLRANSTELWDYLEAGPWRRFGLSLRKGFL